MMDEQARSVLNINLGVLGHVDSGKTSLVAALSTTLSTAALDKHPQSKERGITLDLGFSSFKVKKPEGFECSEQEIEFTLVDCPGHASLIRTIIGGAQIIDAMILVIDVTKGIQAQTAECLVIGEIVTDKMVIALNKIDQIADKDREKQVQKVTKKIQKTLQVTKFKNASIVPVAANPQNGKGGMMEGGPVGMQDLISEVLNCLQRVPQRDSDSPFLFSVDHCFQIKGQGTVMTGTVIKGKVQVGDTIEIAQLKEQRKVKSMQVFKKGVKSMRAGDRGGICVTQLEAKLIERGLLCTPSSIPTIKGAVACVEKIRFYNGKIESNQKFHITIGHVTVMGHVTAFAVPNASQSTAFAVPNASQSQSRNERVSDFDIDGEYQYQDELYGVEGPPATEQSSPPKAVAQQWLFIKFDKAITVPQDSLLIGSRLDSEFEGSQCRLAFCGKLIHLVDPDCQKDMERLKVYKIKKKYGYIERIMPTKCDAIVKDMFTKEADVSLFIGLKVVTGSGQIGVLSSSFGKSGKVKIEFKDAISVNDKDSRKVELQMKRFVFCQDRKNPRQ